DLAANGEAPGDVANPLVAEHGVHVVTIGPMDWETLARRNAAGAPDLLRGLDAAGTPRGGYRTMGELSEAGAWDDLFAGAPGSDAPTRLLSVARLLEGSDWSGTSRASLAAIAPPRITSEGPRPLDVGF